MKIKSKAKIIVPQPARIKAMITTVIVYMTLICSQAQNLVPNPSFEDYKKLDCVRITYKYFNQGGDISQKAFDSLLYDWITPTKIGGVEINSTLISPTCYQNTSDCLSSDCTTNPISVGIQPKDGYNMCSIILLSGYHSKASGRAYIQTKLPNKLSTGSRYLAGLYTALPTRQYGEYYCNNMGLLFTSNPVSSDAVSTSDLLNYLPQINQEEVNNNPGVWKKVFGCFTATGDEQYLTIGNFFDDEHTKAELRFPEYQYGVDFAFYMVDSVFTEQIKSPFIPNVITPNGDTANEKFVIKDIHFGWWALDVFNRWGSKVYHSEDYRNTWNGDNLSPGVYFYELQHRCPDINYKGTLTIVR